jgi:MPBQ/MSBQ methyltransferase
MGHAFAERYDNIIRHPRMEVVYGASGYFNVGFWVDGILEQADACDRLVDEIAGGIDPAAREIIDVGCGVGAGTVRLAKHFPDARVTGCNISLWQLGEAKRRGVAHVLEMDAAAMPLPAASVDAVSAMESAQHFDTREAFLNEAFRVLRPGGSIALADMLFADREAIGSWLLPAANHLEDPDTYAAVLASVGFTSIEVRDVTGLTWAPHCAAMRAGAPEHADEISGWERSLGYYVFAFARKP